ncbi:37S ribosomal protein S23 mitochondrial [Allomyces arbusculus]|nr:37S ribosomal protein S23 mitochondrial [Allomyces arbusculus]
MSALKVAGGFASQFLESPSARGGLLIRAAVTSALAAQKTSKKALVFDGPSGAGKTCALEQAVASYTNENPDSVVVHVTNAGEWVDGRYPYGRAENGKWQLPTASSLFLQNLLAANKKSTKDLVTSAKYSFGQQQVDANSPLAALISLGAKSNDMSTDVSEAVLEELGKHENVLVAIDHVNALFAKSAYFNQKSVPLHASHFALCKAFYPFFENKTKATVVGATCKTDTRFSDRKLQSLSTVNIVQLPPYSKGEAQMVHDMYLETKVINAPVQVDRLLLLSGGNPAKFLKYALNPRAF